HAPRSHRAGSDRAGPDGAAAGRARAHGSRVDGAGRERPGAARVGVPHPAARLVGVDLLRRAPDVGHHAVGEPVTGRVPQCVVSEPVAVEIQPQRVRVAGPQRAIRLALPLRRLTDAVSEEVPHGANPGPPPEAGTSPAPSSVDSEPRLPRSPAGSGPPRYCVRSRTNSAGRSGSAARSGGPSREARTPSTTRKTAAQIRYALPTSCSSGPHPSSRSWELGTHHWGVLRKITTPLPARASQPRSSSSRVAARSAHTRASTTAGTAHTQWCPQDTGEQNSATYPTTTAAATSCPARRRRHATYAIASPTSDATTNHTADAAVPSSPNRYTTPLTD